MNIKDLMRSGADDNQLEQHLLAAFGKRVKDGWEAERLRVEKTGVHESMATIGG
jgi:cyclic pyranopterin phosphate synthase